MAADPLLPDVCWSWLTGALQARGLTYGEPSGTVTRASSHYFGGLSERPSASQIEIRASWTPREGLGGVPDTAAHLASWCDLLAQVAGLPRRARATRPSSRCRSAGARSHAEPYPRHTEVLPIASGVFVDTATFNQEWPIERAVSCTERSTACPNCTDCYSLNRDLSLKDLGFGAEDDCDLESRPTPQEAWCPFSSSSPQAWSPTARTSRPPWWSWPTRASAPPSPATCGRSVCATSSRPRPSRRLVPASATPATSVSQTSTSPTVPVSPCSPRPEPQAGRTAWPCPPPTTSVPCATPSRAASRATSSPAPAPTSGSPPGPAPPPSAPPPPVCTAAPGFPSHPGGYRECVRPRGRGPAPGR